MSRYEELRDAITANGTQVAYSSAWGDLADALLGAADDMQRLWRATKPVRQYNEDAESMATECPACGWWWRDDEDEQHYSDCPHEALRPLFGEVE